MENYRIYNNAHLALLCGLVLILGISVYDLDSGMWFLTILVLIPLGLIQFITGLHFVLSKRKRSDKIKLGFELYWLISLSYWIVFILLTYIFEVSIEFNFIYLFILAYPISIYQYFLVQKSFKERKANQIKPAVL